MPTLLFTLLAAMPLQADVTVEQKYPDGWRMTISATDETDPLRLAQRLAPRAEQLCGARGYTFGRYTFTLDQVVRDNGAAIERPGALTVVQDVDCGSPPALIVRPQAPVLTEADVAALNPLLESLSSDYFLAIDEGRHADSFAMAATEMTGGGTLEQWTARERTTVEASGAVVSRQIGRLTWYSNPEGAAPGHYGAVDYVASRVLQDECGYLVWYRATGETAFHLVRQETTMLPHDLSAETRAALRGQICIIL